MNEFLLLMGLSGFTLVTTTVHQRRMVRLRRAQLLARFRF